LQVWPIECRERIGMAGTAAAHDAHVDLNQQTPDRRIQIRH
jgi:hypothetical protein